MDGSRCFTSRFARSRERRKPSKRAIAEQALTVEIKGINAESRRTYGSPRVHAELVARGA